MVVDGGTIVAMQPTPMADTTGEGPTAGIWQNMVQMMVLYGWTGKGHGIQWRRLAWKSSHTSQINCYKSDLSVKKQGFSFHICTWLCFSMWYSGLSLHMRTKCICRTIYWPKVKGNGKWKSKSELWKWATSVFCSIFHFFTRQKYWFWRCPIKYVYVYLFHSVTKKFHIKIEKEEDYYKMFSKKKINKALKLNFSPQFLSL